MPTVLPLFYRSAFFIFDVLMPVYGIYANIFTPVAVLTQAYAANPISPVATETSVLLDAMAGWLAGWAFLQVYCFTYKRHDGGLWRAIEVAGLLVDVFMLFGIWRALLAEGRLSVSDWTGNDKGNVGGYIAIASVRLAYILGVGLSIPSPDGVSKKEL